MRINFFPKTKGSGKITSFIYSKRKVKGVCVVEGGVSRKSSVARKEIVG